MDQIFPFKKTTEICFADQPSGISILKLHFSSISFIWSKGSGDAWFLLIDESNSLQVL
jgi:hypothetical protein